MKKPYFVQRGKFKTAKTFTGIDSLITFDYMGSAEFEFGAIPKAFKQIIASLPKLGFKWTNIKSPINGKELWLLCKAEDELPLLEWWNTVMNDKYSARTKEVLFYGDNLGSDGTNFWWDIENGWMAALGQDEIQKLHDALEHSKKKEKPNETCNCNR